MRIRSLLLALLLTALTACGGGGGNSGNTSGVGLSPLTFDVTPDPGSTVPADDVIGYAVEITNPMYAAASSSVPAGYKLAALYKFDPATAPGAGFSGEFTVNDPGHATSAAGDDFGVVYRGVWDSRSQVWNAFRSGVYSHGTGGTFHFHLDYLGLVELLEPTGEQFQVAAFADISSAPVNTEVNFWALSRQGAAPVTYHWDFGDGTSAEGDSVTHSYPLINDYSVKVRAVDALGNVGNSDSTQINITANPVPLTKVTVNVNNNGDGSFDLSATLDGGTPPFSYAWDLDGDGKTDSTEGAHLIWSPKSNLYDGTLSVTDQTGKQVSTDYIVDARTVSLSADPTDGYAPQDVNFTVNAQGIGALDAVVIDFGDGTTGDPGLHTYKNIGLYVSTVSVTRVVNGQNVTLTSDPVGINVAQRPNPHIDSVTPGRGPVGSTVTLDGSFFFSQENGDSVKLSDVPMPVITWTPTQITVTVPDGAVDGPIVIHKANGGDSNPVNFDVAPTPPGQPGLGQL